MSKPIAELSRDVNFKASPAILGLGENLATNVSYMEYNGGTTYR
jgi:hypothetical protein